MRPPDFVFERLRRAPCSHTVKNSLPVVAFGNIETARIATVGLNPSGREYLGADGSELDGKARRFESLTSLGCVSRADLTDDQCEAALKTMRGYFESSDTVYSWFRSLERVLGGYGVSYRGGEVAHLDLVQEATDPTWSGLHE